MSESGMEERAQLEALLALADEAALEVRILSSAAAAREHAPIGSAACRVAARVWVVLAPDDPLDHQIEVLAGALARYRAEFLDGRFMAPALRERVERVDRRER